MDIVLKHTGAFYYDITGMSQPEQNAFKTVFSENAEYGYSEFKRDAEGFITRLYNGVVAGKKALHIPGKNNRRNADVLICQEFRRYYSYETFRLLRGLLRGCDSRSSGLATPAIMAVATRV